ncbi:uncharacterized protein LOC142357579 isoform X2 [Convolutriloba macropyga]|uniref:uncharacterized protein LOC142357579 isoform X2 n=1 Tax=Convolutriloba macropyga TaxID=536237 RepID=UPI003F524A08
MDSRVMTRITTFFKLSVIGLCVLCAILAPPTHSYAMPFSRESVNDYNNMAQMLNNAKRYQFYHYINSGDYYAPMTYSYGMYLPSKRSGATPIFVDPSPQFYLTEPISTRAFNYDDILNAAAAVASSSSSPTNSNTDESSSGAEKKRALSSRPFDSDPLSSLDMSFAPAVNQKRSWPDPQYLQQKYLPWSSYVQK